MRWLCFLVSVSWILSSFGEVEFSTEEDVSVHRFAGSDLVRTPTGITFTQSGKLLVVESNTHFRPEGYTGPATDQIYWLKDEDGDGVADTRVVFFGEDLRATMDIATHPDTGAIYVATRNEVLRLWDEDHDGVADPDRVERKIIFLETEGDYPHNGISGLTFDDEGNLLFGIGENLGAAYTLIGGKTKISDQGEGGNLWWGRADGGDLRRFATGFWNPFGVCHAPGGFIFATDNDPSSRPPSRLHFASYGSDHGYQYRYGRSGQHPFISWDGELPGTVPMLAGTGEAPCDVLFHEGNLYVASWADRQIERYPLTWDGTHFDTEQEIVVRSTGDFRPVAFAVGPDGALYCSDWVKSDYKLHGEGAVWRIENWQGRPREMPSPLERAKLMVAPVEDAKFPEAYWRDPWLATALIKTLAEPENIQLGLHRPDPENPEFDAHQRALMLLAWRKSNPKDPTGVARECLRDPDPIVQLLALKWISDERLEADRGLVEAIAQDPPSPTLFLAAVTALSRIDGEPVDDGAIQKNMGNRLKRADVNPVVQKAAFRVLANREEFLSVQDLRNLYQAADVDLQIEVMLTLLSHPSRKASEKFAQEALRDEATDPRVRRFAREVVGRAAQPLGDAESQPAGDDLAEWLSYVDETAPAKRKAQDSGWMDRGRLVFHRHCASCHRVDGFGKQGGPDLTLIGERGRKHILNSIVNPGAEVAPQYEPWELLLKDRSQRIGFLLGQKGGKSFFADIAGNEFTIDYRDILERKQISVSLMPPGLQRIMSREDLASLVDWLANSR
ncbi:MAG: c-type cytochrome [Verrucomicrobiales bacterium]|nr:c-type cytochrome [Verrucomicrobiales bacterium]